MDELHESPTKQAYILALLVFLADYKLKDLFGRAPLYNSLTPRADSSVE